MYIDTHAHLQDEKLINNIDRVVLNATENNVNKIICSSYDISSSEMSVEISNKFKNVYSTVGVHPEECKEYNIDVEEKLTQLAKDKKVVAIGEIGLDYHYTEENKETQKQVFIKQIILADKLNLPIVIHMRDATGDTMQIIRQYKNHLNNGGVFHCFNASKEILDEIIKLGFYVSYGGAITFNNANSLREIVKQTPLDRILTETDCPYMTPVPHRGEINEPKNINLIIKKISEIKNIEILELEKIIENNTKNIYKI